jgi:hypothetical protein
MADGPPGGGVGDGRHRFDRHPRHSAAPKPGMVGVWVQLSSVDLPLMIPKHAFA